MGTFAQYGIIGIVGAAIGIVGTCSYDARRMSQPPIFADVNADGITDMIIVDGLGNATGFLGTEQENRYIRFDDAHKQCVMERVSGVTPEQVDARRGLTRLVLRGIEENIKQGAERAMP